MTEETCSDEPFWMKVQHYEVKSREIEELVVRVYEGSQSNVFCLPHFYDVENLEKLTLNWNVFPLQKIIATDSAISVLRNLKFFRKLKFEKMFSQSIYIN